jgi:hypothetical protein
MDWRIPTASRKNRHDNGKPGSAQKILKTLENIPDAGLIIF